MGNQLARIVPVKRGNGPMATMGTKVILGDQELGGVTKIVLTAEINDIWRADITCHVLMQPMDALAVIHYPKPWWRRALDWIVEDNNGH